MKTIIHVNQHNIKHNGKTGENKPVLTVKNYKTNVYAHEVQIHGPCKIVYRPDKPLSCGAKVWIETQHEVTTLKEGTNNANSNLDLWCSNQNQQAG